MLSSNKNDLQYTLDQFSYACLDAGLKISMAKTEIMCMSRHPVQCSFQTNGVTLQQTEKFKYLVVTFLSDGRQGNKLDYILEKQVQQCTRSLLIGCTEIKAVYKSKAFCF